MVSPEELIGRRLKAIPWRRGEEKEKEEEEEEEEEEEQEEEEEKREKAGETRSVGVNNVTRVGVHV
jgi:hypothetical protein